MTATSPPSHMKGVIIESAGGVEVLRYTTDLPVPVPKEEVLIKNTYIGVNFIDMLAIIQLILVWEKLEAN
jgi:NADPH2:quinone reductase